jgi:hypothetical protein
MYSSIALDRKSAQVDLGSWSLVSGIAMFDLYIVAFNDQAVMDRMSPAEDQHAGAARMFVFVLFEKGHDHLVYRTGGPRSSRWRTEIYSPRAYVGGAHIGGQEVLENAFPSGRGGFPIQPSLQCSASLPCFNDEPIQDRPQLDCPATYQEAKVSLRPLMRLTQVAALSP